MVTVADVEPPAIVTELGSVPLVNAPICELSSRTTSAAGSAMPRCTVNVAAVPSVTGEAPALIDTVGRSSSMDRPGRRGVHSASRWQDCSASP